MFIVIILFLTIGIAGILFVGITVLSRIRHIRWPWAVPATLLIIYVFIIFLQVPIWIIRNITLLLLSMICGSVIGLLLKTTGSLFFFCIAASIADIVSFFGGPTSKLLDAYREGSNHLLVYLSISLPVAGRMQPVIGIGDLIILAAIYFSLSRLGYRGFLTAVIPLSGLIFALVIGLITGSIFAIPFIALSTTIFISTRRCSPAVTEKK